MKGAAPCTFALAGALVLSAIEAVQSNETIPDRKDPNMISVERELYLEKHCSHCHGANGDGGVNLTNRDLSNPNYVFEAIAEGRERGSLRMLGWRGVLSGAPMWQVMAHVMSISRQTD